MGILSSDILGLRQTLRKSRQDQQDVQAADTLCRRRKSSCESCPSCQNYRSVRLASPLECLGFSVPPCLRGDFLPLPPFVMHSGGRPSPPAHHPRSGYSGDTDPVNPVESFEANSAEHPRLDSLPSSDRGDDSMWENCAKSARSMGLSRSVGDCATHV